MSNRLSALPVFLESPSGDLLREHFVPQSAWDDKAPGRIVRIVRARDGVDGRYEIGRSEGFFFVVRFVPGVELPYLEYLEETGNPGSPPPWGLKIKAPNAVNADNGKEIFGQDDVLDQMNAAFFQPHAFRVAELEIHIGAPSAPVGVFFRPRSGSGMCDVAVSPPGPVEEHDSDAEIESAGRFALDVVERAWDMLAAARGELLQGLPRPRSDGKFSFRVIRSPRGGGNS